MNWVIRSITEKLDKAFEKFKVLADKKKVIKDRDLEAPDRRGSGIRRGALHARQLCD